MAGDGNRAVSYLDKLLPFLDVSPPWFRTWIYVLTVLVGVTVALGVVYYLRAPRTLRCFSVVRPKQDDQVLLSERKRYFVQGTFPMLRAPVEHKIMIEVFQLPERKAVPQEGKADINSYEGRWEHPSVQFAGPGSHEIFITAYLGGLSVNRRVNVICVGKAQQYEKDIGLDRRLRGVPELAPASRDEVNLQRVYRKTEELQREFFKYYDVTDVESRNVEAALGTIAQMFNILDRTLPAYPDDIYLQNVRAFTFKNYAMAMRDLGRQEEFERALGQAERMFAAIRDQEPGNAGAWNGLGSVYYLQGQPEQALWHIERALRLDPSYEAAKEDRAAVKKELDRRVK